MEDSFSSRESPTFDDLYAPKCVLTLSHNTDYTLNHLELVPKQPERISEHPKCIPKHPKCIPKHLECVTKPSRSQRLSRRAILKIIDATWLSMLGNVSSMAQ